MVILTVKELFKKPHYNLPILYPTSASISVAYFTLKQAMLKRNLETIFYNYAFNTKIH